MVSADGGLRALFRAHIADAMWQSVETSGVGRGVPDAWYIFPGGVAGWVEFKLTATRNVGLRPEQVAWLDRVGRLGGRAWVACRRQHPGGPRRGVAADELWLLPATLAREAAVEGLRDELYEQAFCWWWSGGPRRWDWAGVRMALEKS